MSQLLLVGEWFSPWTKKARWALEYCGLQFDYKEFTPTLSEVAHRWRLRQIRGGISVPVLFVGGYPIRGSYEIARYANKVSDGSPLGNFSSIARWDNWSESALAEGRTRVVRCIQKNNKALEESVPPFVPNAMKSLMRPIARHAVKRIDKQYAHLNHPGSIHTALTRTRDALAQSENDYIQEHFSYADITMAVILEVIKPIAKNDPPLGPETLKCWNDEALANEFADLVEWRDRLAATDEISYSQFRS